MIDNDTMLMTTIFQSSEDWLTISAGKPISEYRHLAHFELDTYTYIASREVSSKQASRVLSNKIECISAFFKELRRLLPLHNFDSSLTIQIDDDTCDVTLYRVNGRFCVIARRYCNGQHTIDHDDTFDSLNDAMVRLEQLATVYA